MFLGLVFAVAAATAGAHSTTIPFTLEANHVIIAIAVDGKPTHALFDTGSGNAIDARFAKSLKLKERAAGNVAGAGEGTVAAARTFVRSLQFGDITMPDQNFSVIPLPPSITSGNEVRIDALVGREILHRYVTRIDYDARTITFTPVDAFEYAGDGTAVPLQRGTGAAVVRGSIDGLEGSFQIDTGSAASLILTTPFVDAHDLRKLDHPIGNMVVGRGIGGYTRADVALGKHFSVGDITLDDVALELSTDSRGAFASHWIDGNIGNDVLQRVTLTLDEPHHVVYLERNKRTDIPTPPNRAGLYAQNDDRNFFDVVGVLTGGPAYDAGLRAGDHIVAIDGTPALHVTANAFWNLMRGPPGEIHTFTVDRDGSTSTLSVTLRNIA